MFKAEALIKNVFFSQHLKTVIVSQFALCVKLLHFRFGQLAGKLL